MFKRRQQAAEEIEINVTPVMNLMMVLIPFLLLGAAFYHIGVIPVSTPTHNPHESDLPETPITVAANLVVKADNLKLTISSVSLSQEELDELSGDFPSKGGQLDLEGLQAHLISIKEKYPGSNTIVIVPQDEIQYQVLVQVLDTTREVEQGTDENGDPVYKELFPVTVFSRFIPYEGPPEGEEGPAEGGDFDFSEPEGGEG